jgi:hypothetical protein
MSGHYGNGLSNCGSKPLRLWAYRALYATPSSYTTSSSSPSLLLLFFLVLISHLTNISFYFINIIGASAEASSWNPSPYVTSNFFSLRHLSYLISFIYHLFTHFCPNSSWCTLFFYVISI